MAFDTSIPILSNNTSGYGTYGVLALVDGVLTIPQFEVQSDSVIFLTAITNTTPTGQLTIGIINPLTDFSVRSTILSGNNNSFCYFRLQAASDNYGGTNPISLPYIIKSGSLQNIGSTIMTNGLATAFGFGQQGNQVIIIGRVNQPSNHNFGNITVYFTGGTINFVSSDNQENTKINYLVLPHPTFGTGDPVVTNLQLLDPNAGQATYGQTNLVAGAQTVTTSACTTSSFVFAFAANNGTSVDEQVLVVTQNNGSFVLNSGGGSGNFLVNWMIIN